MKCPHIKQCRASYIRQKYIFGVECILCSASVHRTANLIVFSENLQKSSRNQFDSVIVIDCTMSDRVSGSTSSLPLSEFSDEM